MKKLLLGALLLLSALVFGQEQEIKSYSMEKWGSDYSMVKYEIEKQTKAKDGFLAYYKEYGCSAKETEEFSTECKILLDAYSKWKVENTKYVDWSMVLYESNKQLSLSKQRRQMPQGLRISRDIAASGRRSSCAVSTDIKISGATLAL